MACDRAREAPVNPVVGSESANVGLFTPGSTLGAMLESTGTGASDASTAAVVDTPMGDRCMGTTGDPGTPCMLTVTFMTTPIGEHWKPANVGAAWIEDSSGTYIKTIERWAAIRSRSLYHWLDHACATSWPEMDAVSTATMPDHNAQHSSTWDGKDFNGRLVPDGMYRLFIEVTETETNYGPMGMVDFEKGSSASMLQPPDAAPYKGLTLSYTPSAGGGMDEPADAGHAHADAGGVTDTSMDAGSGTIEGAASSGATSEPGLDAGPTLTP
jgi:hypothetical protein